MPSGPVSSTTILLIKEAPRGRVILLQSSFQFRSGGFVVAGFIHEPFI